MDVSLRDGGYLNDWCFSQEAIDLVVVTAVKADADVIEIGYCDDEPGLPAAAACPVLYGPHVGKVRHAVRLLEACQAGRRVEGPEELAGAVVALLRDPAAARRAGDAGREVLGAHRGSAERSMRLVESVLPSPA